MTLPKFREEELKVVATLKGRGSETPLYDFPLTMTEATKAALLDKHPCWVLTDVEGQMFTPHIIPDNIARGFVYEDKPYNKAEYGGLDMFGISWDYIETVGGSMVRPGKPLLEDVNDWKKLIKMPDIDAWDWKGSLEENRAYLSKNKATRMTLLNGCWFERLISFMDFEGAAMALLDDDQYDALKEMTHELTDLYIRIVDKVYDTFGDLLAGLTIHDDWGSQMAPFFSEKVARDLYLPEMRRFTDHVHSLGYVCDLHSCGHVEDRCGVFVDAGFDSWSPMVMNNFEQLYDKYGDKIAITIATPFTFDPETASEEEQRACARKFVERFCKPGTTCSFGSRYTPELMTPAFREELYKASRIAYCG